VEVKFYCKTGNTLWTKMKYQICECIINHLSGHNTPTFCIHFDKMLYSTGWFAGYVEIWKGRVPREKNRRRIPFTAKVWDWGTINNRNYADYRTCAGVYDTRGRGNDLFS
jgi:hypothetical protein